MAWIEEKWETQDNKNELYISELLKWSNNQTDDKNDLMDKIEKSKQWQIFTIYSEKDNAIYKIKNWEIIKEPINSNEKKDEWTKEIIRSTKDSLYALIGDYKNYKNIS